MGPTTPSEQITENAPANGEFEGEIREFIRKDVTRRKRPEAVAEPPASDNVSALVQRVAGASLSEIDGVIEDLRSMREFLRNEGERVQREIASYATATQTAATSIRTIADSVAEWRRTVAMPPPFRG
jgi:hypothetical protein